LKHELQNILSGKSQVEFGASIQAAARYFRRSKSTSEMAQGSIDFKKQEEGFLEQFYHWPSKPYNPKTSSYSKSIHTVSSHLTQFILHNIPLFFLFVME
jgi:hypothetical protein